jgi:hypothetical protein
MMAKLSITTAWNESAEFLRLHFGPLLTIAVALIALPNVALKALGPRAAAPGEVPEPGLWLLLLPLVLALGFVGSLAISTLALGRERVVGDSLRHALRRTPAMLGAVLILVIVLCLVVVPTLLLLGLDSKALLAPTPATAGKLLPAMLLALAVSLFFAVRLLLLTPVAAAEPLGPVAIIARSWALTRGYFWKLLGFVLLTLVAALVILLVVSIVFGLLVTLVAGPPQPGTIAGLLILLAAGLLNAVYVVVMTTLVARIYVQLAGAPAAAASGT